MLEEIALIGAQRAAVLRVIASFAPGDWARATVCDPWTVHDVVAHLVDGELALGAIYRGELREQPYTDPETGIARWKALPGPAVASALWQHGIATQRVLDVMTPETWRAPIRAFGCREIRQLVRLQLFELCLHGSDVTRAVGSPPIWDDALGFLVEFVLRAGPKTMMRRAIKPDGALRIETAGKKWTLDGRGDAWALTDADAPSALTIDAAALVYAVTGRASIDDALGGAKVDGDLALARQILDGWQVVAQP